ncbi:hypothetical protein B0H67DRAFT_645801 [Lasiosphaeris hirsuta]|uniref:F-box domain-containing protein n=1 Tax=Lasiosphaeris hirsuta TaxID=260670 RepID=A0AA40AHX0_9PEZI|nr:hypothetical protein B0H67DRAFT_645801 [Lasiosphaeris hirsuta]
MDQPVANGAIYGPQPAGELETKNDCQNDNTTYNEPMHPLMAAAHQNSTKSNLCRLPDAILIRLMQASDKTTVKCLGRRIFLRLFPAAFDLAKTLSLHYLDRYPWSVSTRKLSTEENANLLSLLARDAYCKHCLSARQAPDWEARVAALAKTYLHCFGCNTEHPACLFSVRQRNRTWGKSKQICIGHQGYMRLCKHVTVPWSSVVAEAERRLLPDATCDPRRKLFPEQFPDDEFKLSRREVQIRRHMTCCPYMPTVTCTFRESVAAPPLGALVVKLAWPGHLPLAMELDGCCASEDLERGLRRLYREQGHFICPQRQQGPVLPAMLDGSTALVGKAV